MPNIGKDISLTKLVIYLNDNTKKVLYSMRSYDNKGRDYGKQILIDRFINLRYKGKFKTALMYDNLNNNLIHKWVNGQLLF